MQFFITADVKLCGIVDWCRSAAAKIVQLRVIAHRQCSSAPYTFYH